MCCSVLARKDGLQKLGSWPIVSALQLQAVCCVYLVVSTLWANVCSFLCVPLGQALLVLASVSCEAGASNLERQRGARERAERSSCAHALRCE